MSIGERKTATIFYAAGVDFSLHVSKAVQRLGSATQRGPCACCSAWHLAKEVDVPEAFKEASKKSEMAYLSRLVAAQAAVETTTTTSTITWSTTQGVTLRYAARRGLKGLWRAVRDISQLRHISIYLYMYVINIHIIIHIIILRSCSRRS